VERGRRIVGLDAVTGETRWTLPLGADPVPTAVMCTSTSELLACVVGPVPSDDRRDLVSDAGARVGIATLWAIDPVDGTVRAHHPIDGWVMTAAAAGADLVVATYTFGLLRVTRFDPVTAQQIWQTERFVTARTAINGRIRLVVGGGLVMAKGSDSLLLLDAETGERQRRPSEALGVDESRLMADGTLVRVQYRLIDSSIVARSSLSVGDREPWLTVEGSVLASDVSDGTSGLVYTADGLGVDGVGAYRPGAEEPVWRSPAPATRVSVDAAGRVVVRNGGMLAALDSRTGTTIWVRDLGAVSGPAQSDGQRMLVLAGGTDDLGQLVALDVQTGDVEWVMPLPEGTQRVVQLGTQLYALGDGVLVALR
jgi:outer membrane protein assembly factor BamB